MKKFLLLVILAAAAVLTTSAQGLEKTVTMYGERPNADLYRDETAPQSTQVIEITPAEKNTEVSLATDGVPVEYWYKYTPKETYLVIMTGKNEKITYWFKNASEKTPKITWDSAVITFANGTTVTIKYEYVISGKLTRVITNK